MKWLLTSVLFAALAGAIWLNLTAGPKANARKHPESPELAAARTERAAADRSYASADPTVPVKAYTAFISKNERNPDPKVQDEVANARLKIGYVLAKAHDYSKAHDALKTAEKEYRGTGQINPDFGGLKDQAAYQAAVCLMADGKKADADAAFHQFIKEYQTSPLVHAAYRRLVMLNGGKTTNELDQLLANAVAAQQKQSAFEMSTCGPKAIEHLVSLLHLQPKTYEEIAKRCGTTDKGTTLEGMQMGLKSLGIDSYAYELTRGDFNAAPLPAIWLIGEHFVVLERFEKGIPIVYDPLYKSQRPAKIAPEADKESTAIVLTTKKMVLGDDQ